MFLVCIYAVKGNLRIEKPDWYLGVVISKQDPSYLPFRQGKYILFDMWNQLEFNIRGGTNYLLLVLLLSTCYMNILNSNSAPFVLCVMCPVSGYSKRFFAA